MSVTIKRERLKGSIGETIAIIDDATGKEVSDIVGPIQLNIDDGKPITATMSVVVSSIDDHVVEPKEPEDETGVYREYPDLS